MAGVSSDAKRTKTLFLWDLCANHISAAPNAHHTAKVSTLAFEMMLLVFVTVSRIYHFISQPVKNKGDRFLGLLQITGILYSTILN